MRRSISFLALFTVWGMYPLYSQASFAPVALFLDNNNRSGYILADNGTEKPQEVSIEFVFGYPVSDSTGKVTIFFPDSLTGTEPNAAPWLYAYPGKFRLEPYQRRKIRFIARPPQDLPVGEYWARPIITSTEMRKLMTGDNQPRSIEAKVYFQIRSVLALSYRNGPVSTGITIQGIRAKAQGDSLVLLLDMKRTGNAAYIGNAILRLYDSSGTVVKTITKQIAVYYTLRRRFDIDLKGLSPGEYVAEFELNTRRNDSPGKILQSTPVIKTVALTIP
ncbi:MAG: hypothetical protein GXO82_00525 [Chlorobi bacterium]|nr:hypothetical protein [Chlorobiota bacterium]